MSAVLSANIQAKVNGNLMESWVKALYPSAKFNYQGAIDCTIEGVKCEIKSCQTLTHDSHHANGLRSGRIVLNATQHEALCRSHGDYIALVHNAGNPFIIYRFPAKDLKLTLWEGNKSIAWKTFIFGGLFNAN